MVYAQILGDQIQEIVDVFQLIDSIHWVALSATVVWEYFTVEADHVVYALLDGLLFEGLVVVLSNVGLGCVVTNNCLFVSSLCFFYLRWRSVKL